MSKKEKLCTFSQDMEGMLSDTDKDNGLSKELRGMRVQDIQLNNLHTFKGHPFKVEENSEFYELVQSIKKEGVLIPILVRTNPYGEGYEIIAGHRRRLACEWIRCG